jgi:hypothetical protein
MKDILHLKTPIGDGKELISPEYLGRYMLFIKERLGSKVEVIASPFEPCLHARNGKLMNFDLANLTNEEFEFLIGMRK